MKLRGRKISPGKAEGEVMASREEITFLGGVDPRTGIVTERGHELEGKCISGKILVFPSGKGSTVGSYILYQLKKNGRAPVGIINEKADETVAVGAIISGIPMLDSLEAGTFKILKNKMRVKIDADRGYLEVDYAGSL
ncbi:MAG: DUF126 domain-containing protein [Candidatus Hydrothermarchaeaceae archaeon]